MVRNVTKPAVCAVAAVAFAAVPGTAYGTEGVDERTGPVGYANAAALAVVDDGSGAGGGSVISETQRSPLLPGTSRLSPNRSRLPQSDAERDAAGPNYLLRIGGHDITATLRDTHVPAAAAEADFVLTDRGSDKTVLELRAARSEVECLSPDRVRERATADRLSLLTRDGQLRAVDLPKGDGVVKREDLPFGPPIEVESDGATVTSDVTIRRVTSFDQLLRQDQWRDGDVTAVAGWLVEIVTHVQQAEESQESQKPQESQESQEAQESEQLGQSPESGEPAVEQATPTDSSDTADSTDTTDTGAGSDTETSTNPPSVATSTARSGGQAHARQIRTKLVLGGVSCSLPTDFTARDTAGASTRPSVPLTIPAGVRQPAQQSAAPAADNTPLGVGLLGGGVALGALALALARLRGGRARRGQE